MKFFTDELADHVRVLQQTLSEQGPLLEELVAVLVAVTISHASTRSAPPAAMRTACNSPCVGAIRTWLMTAPFFCEIPVKSSTVQPLPSR